MTKRTIAYIAAGAGGMYCGNCLHDNTLAAAMIAQGHDVHLVPTYTPLKTDEDNVSLPRVFMGGINVYLQQASPVFRYLPRFMRRWLDAPWLIRLATGYSLSMRAEDLGALAISILKGEHGHQQAELAQLVDWLATDVRPEVVQLSNVLLAGFARPMRARLRAPVLCTLSGEDLFLEQLKEPYTSEARRLMAERAKDVAGFVSLNRYYADRMIELLDLDPARVHVIPHGLNLKGHTPRTTGATGPRVIGYVGRIAQEKGLDYLAAAFEILAKDPSLTDVRLEYAGYLSPAEKPYLAKIEAQLARAGLSDRFAYRGELDRAAKIAFLHSLYCLAMPCSYPESKGLPVLEALANGVPVVVSSSGAFPEIIAETKGGLLAEPKNAADLAQQLARLLTDRALAERCAAEGQAAVHHHHSAARMAERTIELYDRVLSSGPPLDPPTTAHADQPRSPAESSSPAAAR